MLVVNTFFIKHIECLKNREYSVTVLKRKCNEVATVLLTIVICASSFLMLIIFWKKNIVNEI